MKKLLTFILASTLALSFATFSACKARQPGNNQAGFVGRGQSEKIDRYEAEIKKYEEADQLKMPPKGAVLFTGSSSIRMWKTLEQDFAPLPVLNRGFGGSTLPEVGYYAQRIIYKYRPAVVVLYCGENDIAENEAPPFAFQNFKKLIGDLEQNLPEATVIVVSAKPSPLRWNLWPSIRQYNKLTEQFAKNRPNLRYVDISELLLGADGQPDARLFTEDKLHINSSGYERWVKTLKPVIEQEFHLETEAQH